MSAPTEITEVAVAAAVNDAVRAVTSSADHVQALYREAQLVLRALALLPTPQTAT